MKILIVGGAGYLGGGVTEYFQKTKHEILVYDLVLYEDAYRKKVPFIYGDIRDRQKLKKYLDWADAVVWLAAIVGDPACGLRDSLTREINQDAVEFLKDNFKGRIVFMSTCSVYGANEKILDETSPVNPLSLYARTKLASEQHLANSNAVCFRLGTLFGVSDDFSRVRFDLVVNTLAMRAMLHGRISVFGGTQYRPLLHVRDVAEPISRAVEQTETGIFNLHYQNYTIVEIAQTIKSFFPDVVLETTNEQFQDNRNYSVTSDKAKKAFGFNPVVSLEKGVEELKTLLAENRVKNTFIARFSNYQYLRQLMEEHPSPLGREIRLNV